MRTQTIIFLGSCFALITFLGGCSIQSPQSTDTGKPTVQEALSKPDQAFLVEELAQVLGVDATRIVMHDIRKDPKLWGVAGNKYYFDVTVLNTANSDQQLPNQYFCEVYWHQIKKGQPDCSLKR